MAHILYGKPVAEKIQSQVAEKVRLLSERGHTPTLAVLRAGARPDDLAYERRIINLCEKLGIRHMVTEVSGDIRHAVFQYELDKLNESDEIDGVLVFRPLPSQIDEEAICKTIPLVKDVDRVNPDNLKILFTELDEHYSPCTAEAVLEMLDYYNVPLEGANVVIVNRSLVLGRPLGTIFLGHHSTVTIAHSRSRDLPSITRGADILVLGIGKAHFFGPEYVGENTVVIDVGINFVDGQMTGDADFEAVSEKAAGITPVPGGIGAVTTSLLLRHLTESAEARLDAGLVSEEK